jgi:hypothetical protein
MMPPSVAASSSRAAMTSKGSQLARPKSVKNGSMTRLVR